MDNIFCSKLLEIYGPYCQNKAVRFTLIYDDDNVNYIIYKLCKEHKHRFLGFDSKEISEKTYRKLMVII